MILIDVIIYELFTHKPKLHKFYSYVWNMHRSHHDDDVAIVVLETSLITITRLLFIILKCWLVTYTFLLGHLSCNRFALI